MKKGSASLALAFALALGLGLGLRLGLGLVLGWPAAPGCEFGAFYPSVLALVTWDGSSTLATLMQSPGTRSRWRVGGHVDTWTPGSEE